MQELKKFQKATVNHVIDRFNNGQNKILVADEVGLGKTLIARGVISRLYEQKNNDEVFNVVYICSNQNIANQNKRKLAIQEADVPELSGDRLSMQSYNIYKQVLNKKSNTDLQIIALTPETSFNIKNRKRGNSTERALICATLCKMPEFQTPEFPDFERKLKKTMYHTANEDRFGNSVNWWKSEISKEYIEFIHERLFKKLSEVTIIVNNETRKILDIIKNEEIDGKEKIAGDIVKQLRIIFAKISLKMLKPDIVIMDEFQKFKNLIDTEEETETNLIAKEFFNDDSLKVLLLSATPYTLYATQEELQDAAQNGVEDFDIYHKEFLYVMKFLFGEGKFKNFEAVWHNHSKKLYSINGVEYEELLKSKEAAENIMYDVMSRTERNYNPSKVAPRKTITINDLDIKSYIQMARIVDEMKKNPEYARTILPVDYVKSCPYILSFTLGYKLKNQMKDYLVNTRKSLKNTNLLLLNRRDINNYKSGNIMNSNARLREISNIVFQDEIHNLLWLPPTKKYYKFEAPFDRVKDIDKMTKTLIFSRWEMVPRMISTLFSYNVEKNIYKNEPYFIKPTKRKRGRIKDEEYISWLLLLYPSKTLSELYNPIEDLNKDNIKEAVKQKFVNKIKNYESDDEVVKNYHYLIPLLLDDKTYVDKWFDFIRKFVDKKVIEKLETAYETLRVNPFIPKTTGFREIMANYIIASPANCIYRNLGDSEYTTIIAKNFVNLFNKPHSTAILDNCYTKNDESENVYWKKVLKYCFSGNLQAVIDEYFYMIIESNCLENNNHKNQEIATIVNEAMNLSTNTYNIDMVSGKDEIVTEEMRTHFAIGFSQGDAVSNVDGEEKSRVNRKTNIRSAFNSPFWPFVLTSTSIGQEGLDFHYYCKRIVHWNLPANPIDIEQREGRIDRFKSLAIRKHVAKKNENTKFKENIWKEMFENVEHDDSGLCPFWSLPNNEPMDIEKIIPLYTLSEDVNKYNRAENILELYRLTLGQERQEDLLINILQSNKSETDLKKLFIDLCPWKKEK